MFFKRLQRRYQQQSRVYLDFASAAPVDRALGKKIPLLSFWGDGANPSALHKEGVVMKETLLQSRMLAAEAIDAHSDEIIFTSNATESDNLALLGAVRAFLSDGIAPEEIAVITSPFEHAAVMEALVHLPKGINIIILSQQNGVVVETIELPEHIRAAIVSVMYIQNEIGTIQPITLLAKSIRRLRKLYPEKTILFHTDATQAVSCFPLDVRVLGVDLMTLGSTKLPIPKGVGMLYKKRAVKLLPIFFGGGQEFGFRPGTEPVALIHVFAHALSLARIYALNTHARLTRLQSRLIFKLSNIPSVNITAEHSLRSPHITHITIPGIDSELLVLELDARGVAVSAKSACTNEVESVSHIVSLLYPDASVGAVRFSFGRTTTTGDIDRAVIALSDTLRKYHLL